MYTHIHTCIYHSIVLCWSPSLVAVVRPDDLAAVLAGHDLVCPLCRPLPYGMISDNTM